ncbi:MAG: ParB/RepB/Spo0J family partition protein [Thermoleophilia bacterium]|nr:ParB/RepB/Spo0J family partition protein [Thermoleophilia bacterium]
MAERRGMGRGLGAILPESSAGPEMREIPVEAIEPNPGQPRSRFEDDALGALADSIAASGVVQPLIVRALSGGSYELIAGERRWRAAQIAGVERVPVVIRDSDEADRLEVALIENMVREDLNPVEEARACAALVEDLGLSKEELGRRVGRSRPQISNLIRLLELPDEVLGMLESGELTEGHGRAVLQVPDHADRRRLGRQARDQDWSVRQTEAGARSVSKSGRRKAKGLSAEEVEAIEKVSARLESGLGHQVRIRPRSGGLSVEILVDDLDQAGELADRLG